MAALNISTYKAELEKPWLAVMMQNVHKEAGTGPVLGCAPQHLPLSSSECPHRKKCLHLHGALHQGWQGEANYLSSPGRSKRQDLLVLILQY